MRRLLVAVVVLMVIPVTSSAGGGGDLSACSGFATGSVVSMLDSCFDGTAHFAPAGETITIVNDGFLPHTFTAVDGSFDTGQLEAGETSEITIEEPGLIQVFCALHGTAAGDGMAGVLVVGESEPLPVSAPANIAVIKEAVAGESEPLAAALENQSTMIAALTSAQSRLTDTVEAQDDLGSVSPSDSSVEPWVFALMGAGAATGLIALATSLSVRRRLDASPATHHAPLEA